MGLEAIFDPRNWAPVPFHFWSVVFFVLGTVVGSFLNVCIHRLPRGESLWSPPSHCPHCHYAIPWYLNIPVVTWLMLRGQCRHCGAPISVRYWVVELLTGLAFLSCWLAFGAQSVGLALIYCVFLAGLIVASFIDFEHFIIPDELTISGAVLGVLGSLAFPALQGQSSPTAALKHSFLGMAVGAGLVYLILRLGKLLFGRQRLKLSGETKIVFTEDALVLPDKRIPYEDLFYRKSDAIVLRARTVELVDRCYARVVVRLGPEKLRIGDDEFDPATVPHLEAVTAEIVLPREAMGLGDVKFMAAIGAFLGWPAVVFSLMLSSVLGSLVGVSAIVLGRRAWSSRMPYGPYIAMAAAVWVFGGRRWLEQFLAR